MRALQKELDDAKELRQREREREARRAKEDEEELQILRDRCEKLEEDRETGSTVVGAELIPMLIKPLPPQADASIVEQLRSDMESLIVELNDLSKRNDELMTAKDSDLIVIRDLDNQLKEYKRKYELAKTELRSVKG